MSTKIKIRWHDVGAGLGQPKQPPEVEEVDALELAVATIKGQRMELELRRSQLGMVKHGRTKGIQRGKEVIRDKTSRRDEKLLTLAKRFAEAMNSYERMKLRDLLKEFAIATRPDEFDKADLLRFLKRRLRLKISTRRISQILDKNGVEIR